MTNFEWIKGLSEKELADFLNDIVDRNWISNETCSNCREIHGGKCPLGEDDSCKVTDVGIETWLFMERLSTIKEAGNERLSHQKGDDDCGMD